MIYSALAAVIVALLAWDFGRRCLAVYSANDVHRSRLDQMCADIARIDDETSERIDSLQDRHDNLGTALNARVQVLAERLDDVIDRAIPEAIDDRARQKLNEDERYARRVNERLDFVEGALANVNAEPPDVAKYTKALENLWRETREELAKRPTHDELKAAETRLHGVLSGSVAKGAKRFA